MNLPVSVHAFKGDESAVGRRRSRKKIGSGQILRKESWKAGGKGSFGRVHLQITAIRFRRNEKRWQKALPCRKKSVPLRRIFAKQPIINPLTYYESVRNRFHFNSRFV